MPYHRLSTAKIARAVGCHPNTVRLYEKIGFLSPVERSPRGYRLYTEAHLEQARAARLLMGGGWPGPAIRRSGLAVIHQAARMDWAGALELACRHRSLVHLEQEYAETAVAFLEGWARGENAAPERHAEQNQPLSIKAAARVLSLTPDTLRSWERSGLLDVPRCPTNRYRWYYPAQIGRLRVIRMLRQAGYSLMAILRMLVYLDCGAGGSLREHLDTPRPDEDACVAADRWLSTLAEQERRAGQLVAIMEEAARKFQQEAAEPA